MLAVQEQTVRELETRVKHLSVEVEKGNTLRQKVTQEKAQLEIHIASISAELQEANRRCVSNKKQERNVKGVRKEGYSSYLLETFRNQQIA